MFKVQRSDASIALERQFGLRGLVGISLDEVVVATANVGDFAGRSPYEQRWVGGDVVAGPASGAGTYAGIYITPGPGTILVVESLAFSNDTGATGVVHCRLFTPANLAAVTLIGAATAVPRLNGRMRASGLIDQMRCVDGIFHHTTAAIGALFAAVMVPSAQDRTLGLGRGIVLDGTDPAGPIRLVVMSAYANAATPEVNYVVTEYSSD